MARRLHQRISLLRGQSGKSRAGKISHLARSGSQLEHRIRFNLPARGASHIIIVYTTQVHLLPFINGKEKFKLVYRRSITFWETFSRRNVHFN